VVCPLSTWSYLVTERGEIWAESWLTGWLNINTQRLQLEFNITNDCNWTLLAHGVIYSYALPFLSIRASRMLTTLNCFLICQSEKCNWCRANEFSTSVYTTHVWYVTTLISWVVLLLLPSSAEAIEKMKFVWPFSICLTPHHTTLLASSHGCTHQLSYSIYC